MRRLLFTLPLLFFATASADAFDVVAKKNMAYHSAKDADPVRHRLDIYYPKNVKNYPVLFFVHGGGWRKGSKDGFEAFARTFAAQGIGTVVTNYRLSPQVKHPEHIRDVAKAFAWTKRNIAKFGGDTQKIFVSGHSAGGHLAALLATDPMYLGAEKLSLNSIAGAIPISGVYRLSERQEPMFGDVKARSQASPLNHITSKRPAFLLLIAEQDIPSCLAQSEEMVAALKKQGGQASHRLFKDRNHGTIVRNVPNEGDPVAEAITQFISEHSGLKAPSGQNKN